MPPTDPVARQTAAVDAVNTRAANNPGIASQVKPPDLTAASKPSYVVGGYDLAATPGVKLPGATPAPAPPAPAPTAPDSSPLAPHLANFKAATAKAYSSQGIAIYTDSTGALKALTAVPGGPLLQGDVPPVVWPMATMARLIA